MWNNKCSQALAELWRNGIVSPRAITADEIDPIFDLSPVFAKNGVSLLRFRAQYKIKAGKYMCSEALKGVRRRGSESYDYVATTRGMAIVGTNVFEREQTEPIQATLCAKSNYSLLLFFF